MSLGSRALLRATLGILFAGAMLFFPAGTFRFWQAWVWLAIAFLFVTVTFTYFYRHDPALLERRMRSKEKLSEQKRLVGLLKPAFAAFFLLPGFDHRLGWSRALWGEVPPGSR